MLRLSFAVEFGAAPPSLHRAVTATLPEFDSIVYLLSIALNKAGNGADGTGDTHYRVLHDVIDEDGKLALRVRPSRVVRTM
ncbi:hypothetical protein ACQP1K_18655 [Sphaerimonospora sp. CA-214678]|uniref:hypothetical protein n=1 Tax=Sphaerimonospora sp. CA-214678 TaxID=3240029 RepID=UPI003D8FFCE0